ncbi:recombinase family protein [Klebsiella pneumoniae]|uniref:recombinase family protein n=1 Tax=Klebsiella pneumoniae TaxID=573 RepID=UPI00265D3DC4|nr:recombinase family protein [Klebsiella pneumoniae]
MFYEICAKVLIVYFINMLIFKFLYHTARVLLWCFIYALIACRPNFKKCYRKLNTMGHSARDLITLVSEMQARGVNFRSLTDSIDTSTPAGRFFFHVMSALAEMERELIVERTRAGLAAAREQGRFGGRRRVMTEEVVERCRRMLENGATRQQIADVIGVNVKTLYKYLPAAV